jgi:exportin-7
MCVCVCVCRSVVTLSLGLDQVDNHHEFSRLLYRFKSNYQLTQLVAVDKYSEWIALVAEFTCATFKVPFYSPFSFVHA